MSRTRAASDTDTDTLRVMSALYAGMTPEQKLRRVRELTVAVSRLALAGLRLRHPGESEADLLRRLARVRLGGDVVAAAYDSETRRRDA